MNSSSDGPPGGQTGGASAVVVGGGPAGALLAYLLASRDVPVTLIERHCDFARAFRGEGVTPSGQRMFVQAGLWEAFDALPHSSFARVEMHYRAKRFATFNPALRGTLAPRFVSQPAMLEMLVAMASAFPAFSFRRGVRVTEPILRRGRVVGVALTGPDGDERIEADYTFACDGRFSSLRKAAGLDQPRQPEFFDIVWCKIPMPPFDTGEPVTVRGFIGNHHLGLFIPAYDNLLQVGWVITKGSYKDFREMGIDGWMLEMARHVTPQLATHLRQSSKAASHPFLLDVVCDCYPRWAVPGLMLLGDAAHPMSPVGAQGINIALRDAVVAANHFVPRLLGGASRTALDAAAVLFEAERRAEVEPVQALQRRIPRYIIGSGLAVRSLVLTARLIGALGLGPIMERLTARRRNIFIDGTTEVRLEV